MKSGPKFDTKKKFNSINRFNNRYYIGVRKGATPTPNTLSVIERVAVIKLRVNNGCGDGTGSFEVKIGTQDVGCQ